MVEESQKLLHLLSLKYCNLTQLKFSVKATMKALYTGQSMFEMSNRKGSRKRRSDRVNAHPYLQVQLGKYYFHVKNEIHVNSVFPLNNKYTAWKIEKMRNTLYREQITYEDTLYM